MSWPIPPAAGVDLGSWDFIKQFWFASRERNIAAGQGAFWPRQVTIWDGGTITAITATTLTDSGVTSREGFTPDGWPYTPMQRWAGWIVEDASYIPSSYDVVIDCPS